MAEGWQRLALLELALFNLHVSEFAGFEDFAALEAFDKFDVFFASHNLYPRVLAFCHCGAHSGGFRRLDGIIDSGLAFRQADRSNDDAGIGGIFSWKRAACQAEIKVSQMGCFSAKALVCRI